MSSSSPNTGCSAVCSVAEEKERKKGEERRGEDRK